MFPVTPRILAVWALLAGVAAAQNLTVATNLDGIPLQLDADSESDPLIVNVVSDIGDTNLEDFLTGWQLSLSLAPDLGSTGSLTFASATEPANNYIFSSVGNLGTVVVNSDDELLAFDTNFPFSGGVEVPADLPANLLKLSVHSSNDASGSFGLFAMPGLGESEWTDASQPELLRREFDNIRDGNGPTRIADIVVNNSGNPDYNRSGIVDAADYVTWLNSLGSMVNLDADGNRSGKVDLADYEFWRDHLGNTASGSGRSATTIPELGSFLLAALGIACWFILYGRCLGRDWPHKTARIMRTSSCGSKA